MDQLGVDGVEEEVPVGGADGNDAEAVEGEPFDGGDVAVERGEGGADLHGGGGVVQGEEEDDGAAGEGDGGRVEGGEDVAGFEPALFAGADLGEVVAGDATEFSQVGAPRHLPGSA